MDLLRATHLLAGAAMAGGALVVALAPEPRSARAFEWVFWGALGLAVATGVGNVARGAGGVALLVKLALVLAGLLLSAARVMALVRGRVWRLGYATTAAGVAAVASLGVLLAHG